VSKPTDTINLTGNYEASLAQLGKQLGADKIRRMVFKNMYGRHKRPRSKKEIAQSIGIDGSKLQQVQNALTYLEKYHFIEKIANIGRVGDGSRVLYQKIESLRGHVSEIEKLADDKTRREKLIAQIRNVETTVSPRKRATKTKLKKKKTLTVLFLTSNPDPSSNLRTDVEFARVQRAIRASRYRENVKLEHRPAADIQTILDGMNELRPEVVHFSGHGNTEGVIFDDNSIPEYETDEPEDFSTRGDYELIAKALSSTDFAPKLLILNSCLSSFGARILSEHVEFVVTMDLPISDIAASVFSPQLYSALASGQSLKSAFSQAVLAVEMAVIEDVDIPSLTGSRDPAGAIFV